MNLTKVVNGHTFSTRCERTDRECLVFGDRRLSKYAKELFIHISRLPEGAEFDKTYLCKALPCSPRSLNKAFRELQDYGWIDIDGEFITLWFCEDFEYKGGAKRESEKQ